jgi:23S rRNA (adenine2503-C2)-methyltransferase
MRTGRTKDHGKILEALRFKDFLFCRSYGGYMDIIKELHSTDGAVKYLLRLEDGQTVETLYMHDEARALTYHSTVCVSSQVGCAMGCRFCATGAQGFIRNLTADEITDQVDICDQRRNPAGLPSLDAVVFAGMGEPLANDAHVLSAITRIKRTMGISNFELATVGIVPKIRTLADFTVSEAIHLRLNVSLHAASDEKRTQLIPMTTHYSVEDIIGAAADYAGRTGATARIRYMLLRGFNDTGADAENLIRLLSGKPVKLILSAYNDNGIKDLVSPDALDVLEFYRKMKEYIDCDIFKNFGASVLGGCGQLRRDGPDKIA